MPFILKLTELEYSKMINFPFLIQILEMYKVSIKPEKFKDVLNSPLQEKIELELSIHIEKIQEKLQEKFHSKIDAFRYFDTEKRKRISFNLFMSGLKLLGFTFSEEQVRDIFKYLDLDMDNKLSL